MLNWDDLKYFTAVARHGSTTAAARSLGLDQSTVQRRLAQLEERIGQALVERSPAGYRLTAYGLQLLPHAQRVEQEVIAFQDLVRRSAREQTGTIRLTCPEPIVARITQSRLLSRLAARHPGLHVEFVMSDHYVDLNNGEADVALRSGDTVDSQLVGRKIADSLWAVYGSRNYLSRHGTPVRVNELAAHAWIGFDHSMAGHRATQWLHQSVPNARMVATSASVLGLVHSVKADVGLAALPTALGNAEPDLVQVLGPVPELTRIWRILTTRQLRRTPRIQAFFEFIASEIDTLRPILTG
ncbi:MAG: hypothetical protein JWP47_254 [Polaromonas sp.]|nr:hypothetical protein [Polaromonas sp.]